jgi:hypothetical protein
MGPSGPNRLSRQPPTRCYTAARSRDSRGGTTIAEVLRRAWERLVRKQWLILYPLVLGIVDTMAFFAVYIAAGGPITWNGFFTASFYRWSYVQNHFVSRLSWSPALAVAVVAGLAVCVLTAMIRAPYFRAIAGMGYPRAPRGRDEAVRLTLFYLFNYLVLWLLPQLVPGNTVATQAVDFVLFVIAVLIVFADYLIVFEQLPFIPALRRSVQLVRRRWILVTLVVLVIQLIYYGLDRLYDSYYKAAKGIFILLPVSQLLVTAFLVLVSDLVFLFMYQQLRRWEHLDPQIGSAAVPTE